MKTILLCILSCFTAFSVFAQSTVTIEVMGSRNREVMVDGISYPVNDYYSSSAKNKSVITVPNLSEGQHTMLLKRTKSNSTSTTTVKKIFYLQDGYNLNITVNGNGTLTLKETKQRNSTANRTPMSDVNYNALYRRIQNERSSTYRMTALRNELSNSSNYFTTYQARQLIMLTTSESGRLQLAKLAVHRITDVNNISQLNEVLNSQNGRNELTAYIRANVNNSNTTGYRSPMSNADFTELYDDVKDEWSASSKVALLNTEFSDVNNFFSTSQARQLIMLVPDESNRLQLAKNVYRRITDTDNFTMIYDVLNSQNSRNELAAYVRNGDYNNDGNVYRAPMTSANFNELYRNVQNSMSTNSKVTLLHSKFVNENNFFTTSQARQLILLIPDESNRLHLAKEVYRGITDKDNFTAIYDILNSQNSRNELAAYVRSGNHEDGHNDGNVNRTPMSSSDFNRLYSSVQNEWSLSSKVTLLNTQFGNSNTFFTSSQAKQLILLVQDEGNRLHLAKTVYRGITDTENFNIIYDVFNSQSSRNELGAYLNTNYGVVYNNSSNNDNNYSYKTPMSQTDYNNLYREVQNTWGLSAKMTALSSVFANATYYFTTLQAKELVKLVSSESNRFDLAKASYDNITDAGNFSSMYDVLESQSSRDQLAAWVNSYTYNNSSAGNNYSFRTPMIETEYNSLYRGVQNTWGLGAKMSSLSTIFANNSYFFTTAQAKELVKLVSAESNRLILAKASYDNITDPNNFNSMHDVLESQASRDDLAAFVKSNTYNRQ